ncbi:MAG: hypothetical protein HKN92_08830 [Chitinophagales bacterium]|nr:hypothetical protein [Chitinophagales bacterium]
MQIKETSIYILTQLEELTLRLTDDQYTAKLNCLMNNSIGKHLRHILEFYELMLDGYKDGFVNYDNRKHDKVIESDRMLAITKIKSFKLQLDEIIEDKTIQLETSYCLESDRSEVVQSSFNREMIYNIEHAIHHMAIIKIGIRQAFDHIDLDDNFGIAYSTVKYNNKECAQ